MENLLSDCDLSTIFECGNLKVLKQTFKTNPGHYQFKQEHVLHFFETSAKLGNLDVLKWLKRKFSLTRNDLVEDGEDELDEDDYLFVLKIATLHDQCDVVRWLKHSFGLSSDDGRHDDNYLLRKAVQSGSLDMVKCIVDTFALGKKDVVDQWVSAFVNALVEENIPILDYFVNTFSLKLKDISNPHGLSWTLKAAFFGRTNKSVVWLKETFSLTLEHARAGNNSLLRCFIEHGDGERLKSLHDIFGLTREDVKDDFELFIASERGYGSVLSCLNELFGLTSDHARLASCYPLRVSAENGHVENMKILKDLYKLTGSDARSEHNYALRMAAKNGHIHVLECLSTDYGLSTEDAMACDNEAVHLAVCKGNVAVLEALTEHFQVAITEDDMELALENYKPPTTRIGTEQPEFVVDDSLIYTSGESKLGQKPYISEFYFEAERTFQSLEDCLRTMSNFEDFPFGTSMAFWKKIISTRRRDDEFGSFASISYNTLLALKSKMMVFDLHGLRLRCAKSFAIFILFYLQKLAKLCRYNRVEFIVGKGLHSNGEPVLATQLPLMLKSLNINYTVDVNVGRLVVPLNGLDSAAWSQLNADEYYLYHQ